MVQISREETENGKETQKIESIKQDDRSKTKHTSYDNVCKCVELPN